MNRKLENHGRECVRTWLVEKLGGACVCEQVFKTLSSVLFNFVVSLKMRYLGFFYVEAKLFEILSEQEEGGICFAKRSRETY